MVNLILHDPPNAGYMNGTRKNSETLRQEITAGIANGSLKIRLSDGKKVSPQSLEQPCPACPEVQSTGTTAGIVVGCLAAGCLLGILLVAVVVGIYKCMKRSGKTPGMSYSVQKDDM